MSLGLMLEKLNVSCVERNAIENAIRHSKADFSVMKTDEKIMGAVQRFFGEIVHFFLYTLNLSSRYVEIYDAVARVRVSANLSGVLKAVLELNDFSFSGSEDCSGEESLTNSADSSDSEVEENFESKRVGKQEVSECSSSFSIGENQSEKSKTVDCYGASIFVPAALTDLDRNQLFNMNQRLRDLTFESEPTQDFDSHDLEKLGVRSCDLEYFRAVLEVSKHVHLIFQNVYLGDYRSFLSVDPAFLEQHAMTDPVTDIIDLSYYNLDAQEKMKQGIENLLDQEGASHLGIRYILSVTNFQPGLNVLDDDWTRFQPNLQNITRMQLPLDDDQFAWENIKPYLEKAFALLDRARLEKAPCLIHCVQGASRSVAVLTAYLMYSTGMGVDQAIRFISSKRSVATLKPEIRAGLEAYTISGK